MVTPQFIKGSFMILWYLLSRNKPPMKLCYLHQTHIKDRLKKFSGAEVMTSKPPKDDLVRQEETYLIRLSSDKPAPDKTIPEKQRCTPLVLVFPCINVPFHFTVTKKEKDKQDCGMACYKPIYISYMTPE